MQYNHDWKSVITTLISNWFSLRSSMYFILIKDIFFCEESSQVMIKYQCANKRIGDVIPLNLYMSSPLKHATHPNQLFHLGIATERFLNQLEKQKKLTEKSSEIQKTMSRFKQYFYE